MVSVDPFVILPSIHGIHDTGVTLFHTKSIQSFATRPQEAASIATCLSVCTSTREPDSSRSGSTVRRDALEVLVLISGRSEYLDILRIL